MIRMILNLAFACLIVSRAAFAIQAGIEAPQTTQPDEAKRVADWRADLKVLATDLPARHVNALFRMKKEDFDSAAAQLMERIPSLDDKTIAIEFARLAAMIGDTHTQVQIDLNKLGAHVYPIIVRVFSDGVYIIAAWEDRRDLLGKRIVSIDGMPMDEVTGRIGTIFAWENESSLKNTVANWMVVGEGLKTVGVCESAARMMLVLQSSAGEEQTLPLEALAPGKRVPFVGLPDAKTMSLPISWQRKKESYWFESLNDGKALYVRYDRCSDDANKTVKQFCEEVLKHIDDHSPQRIIVDLRRNSGGNSALLHPLIGGIASRKEINQQERVFVLIGRTTFSSAMMNAQEFRSRTNATLIGEPTGGKPNHHGEIRTFTLPHSKLLVQYSTKAFRMVKDDPPAVMPDRPIDMKAADYFGGRDPVLEAVLGASAPQSE